MASYDDFESGPREDGNGPLLDDKLDAQVRHGFVKKVFSIVGMQLLVTTAIAAPFTAYNEWARMFVAQNHALLMVAMFMPLVLICYMACNPSVAREYPKNYFILAAITLCMGLSVGISCAAYTQESVLFAVGLTAAATLGLVAFAFQTKYDFSGSGPYLWTAFLVLFFTGFLMMFIQSRILEIIYASFGALIFSFYIVYDTQLIVGGKHQQQRFGIDDYVFASLTLYLDIINLFLMLLRLFGDRR